MESKIIKTIEYSQDDSLKDVEEYLETKQLLSIIIRKELSFFEFLRGKFMEKYKDLNPKRITIEYKDLSDIRITLWTN